MLNVITTIQFGAYTISITLTAGTTLVQCVNDINQWAFQEFATWINASKGVFGGANIALTYSSVVGVILIK